jgi:hypothetical protein
MRAKSADPVAAQFDCNPSEEFLHSMQPKRSPFVGRSSVRRSQKHLLPPGSAEIHGPTEAHSCRRLGRQLRFLGTTQLVSPYVWDISQI